MTWHPAPAAGGDSALVLRAIAQEHEESFKSPVQPRSARDCLHIYSHMLGVCNESTKVKAIKKNASNEQILKISDIYNSPGRHENGPCVVLFQLAFSICSHSIYTPINRNKKLCGQKPIWRHQDPSLAALTSTPQCCTRTPLFTQNVRPTGPRVTDTARVSRGGTLSRQSRVAAGGGRSWVRQGGRRQRGALSAVPCAQMAPCSPSPSQEQPALSCKKGPRRGDAAIRISRRLRAAQAEPGSDCCRGRTWGGLALAAVRPPKRPLMLPNVCLHESPAPCV